MSVEVISKRKIESRRVATIFCLLFSIHALHAQTYHFPETVRYFTKTTDFGTVHGYLEIVNDTGVTMPMMWHSRRGSTCPPAWNFNFDDQNNFYGTVQHLDSASFDLYPPDAFNQKMIIGLAHNDSVGEGSIYFTVFPQHNRTDSTVIEFHFTITQGTPVDTTDTNETDTTGIEALCVPAAFSTRWTDALEVKVHQHTSELTIYDLAGREVYRVREILTGSTLSITPNTPAVIVVAHSNSTYFRMKVAKSP